MTVRVPVAVDREPHGGLDAREHGAQVDVLDAGLLVCQLREPRFSRHDHERNPVQIAPHATVDVAQQDPFGLRVGATACELALPTQLFEGSPQAAPALERALRNGHPAQHECARRVEIRLSVAILAPIGGTALIRRSIRPAAAPTDPVSRRGPHVGVARSSRSR
jgi:hypothetical protein